jgi:hypothetical protein
MLRLENVAMPLTALTVSVPASVPLAGLLLIVMLTALVAEVTRLPEPSSIETCTAGAIAAAAPTLVGCTLNTSFVAVPALTVKLLLVALVNPAEAAVNVYVSAVANCKALKVATPFIADTAVVPLTPAAVELIAIVALEPVTTLPLPSWTSTTTAGRGVPAVPFTG